MTTRIDTRFAELKREGRAAFVTFLMAGDPDLESEESARIIFHEYTHLLVGNAASHLHLDLDADITETPAA